MTHREIAQEYGVSIERIRQLRREAESVLRGEVKKTHYFRGRDWRSFRHEHYCRLGYGHVYIWW